MTTKKLSDTKKPSGLSFTEKLTDDEIKEYLEDYKEEQIQNIKLGTHVRYFTVDKNGETKFRLGGTVRFKSPDHKYLILENGKASWSVQAINTIFFMKESTAELTKQFKEILFEKNEEIKQLQTYCIALEKRIKDLQRSKSK